MKILQYLLLFTPIITSWVGCSKNDGNEYREMLIDQYHGKYQVVQAKADSEVDVNLDGVASTDILAEVPALENAYLELRVDVQLAPTSKAVLFSQTWANQYFLTGTDDKVPDEFNPQIVVNYLLQPSYGWYEFEDFPLPDKVLVEPSGNIRIFMHKRLYTTSGWKEVNIEVLYKRFTTST